MGNQEAIVQIPDGLYAGSGVTTKNSTIVPKAIYDGGYPDAKDILVRIANGGAGQSGLIGAWADAFIQHCVEFHKFPAFRVRSWFPSRRSSLNSCYTLIGWMVPRRHHRKSWTTRCWLCGHCRDVQQSCRNPVCQLGCSCSKSLRLPGECEHTVQDALVFNPLSLRTISFL